MCCSSPRSPSRGSSTTSCNMSTSAPTPARCSSTTPGPSSLPPTAMPSVITSLSSTTRALDRLQIAAINQPATHISGDFYNWFELDDGRIVVTIGDVTGHGMAAAFLMATTQLLVRTIMPRVLDPALCLRQINKQLLMQTFNGQF